MRFDSFAAFLAMDGHGLYVWSAFGLTFLVLTLNLWLPRWRRKSFVAQEQQIQKRNSLEGEQP
jgi:heme exporter protein D